MKTVSKKALKEASSYVVRLDYSTSMRYEYIKLEATDLLGAMSEAERYFGEDIYLLDIFQKTDIIDDVEVSILYKGTVRSRRKGSWHVCDADHYESPCAIQYSPVWDGFWYAEYEMFFE